MRILLVDDNILAAEAIAGMLTVGGHRAARASTGEAALAMHEPGSWDVVLTDLHLPGMDGWTLIEALRAREPDLPVGVITGSPDELELGAVHAAERLFTLLKPVDPGELLRRLELFEQTLRPGS